MLSPAARHYLAHHTANALLESPRAKQAGITKTGVRGDKVAVLRHGKVEVYEPREARRLFV